MFNISLFSRFLLKKFRVFFLAALVLLLNSQFQWGSASTVYANASCGEPDRSIDVDMDRDGTIDRTVNFDLCFLRTFNYGGTSKKIIVYYTTSNGSSNDRLRAIDTDGNGTNDLSAEGVATLIADWTQEAWTKYRDYGFNDPLGRNDIDVYVYDMVPGLAGWCCGSRHYEYDAPSALGSLMAGNDPKNGQTIAYHEMWHASEWTGKGGWIDEGTASNMTDHINLPVDLDTDNDYISRVNGYLANDADISLTTISYNAALWWTYYMERTGSITSEPDRGRDAMKRFWDNFGTDGLATLQQVIDDLPGSQSLQGTWIDFTVANYVKDIPGTGVPSQFKYVDETQTGATKYTNVALDINEALAVDEELIELANIQPWSARYYQFIPDPAIPILSFEFRQDTNHQLGYTILLIRDDNLISFDQQVGRDFVQTIANANYDKVVIVVSGLSQMANFRYTVNATQPQLRILDPLTGRRAQAGDPAAPDKVLAKVEVLSPTGGGTPVAGIDPADFEIQVGNKVVSPSLRINDAYIQGQYWLLFRAPTQSIAGVYDLQVSYTAALSDTENLAINYVPRADADNMLVIDRSGSMGGNKILAAQNAARLYIDSWRMGDQIGVVSYNENATVDMSLTNWNSTSRTNAINAVNALTAGGNTAIGGGLISGMNELITGGNASHTWEIILLSDGLETATPDIAAFMTAYNARQNATPSLQVPRVHAIALGPDADRFALDKLAQDTGGSFHYAAEPPASPDTRSVTAVDLPNDLAEIYRVIGETVTKQQQVYAERGIVPNYPTIDTHTITIDGSASETLFVFNWSPLSGVAPNVTLRQPDTTDVGPATLFYNGHMVWRIPNPIAGNWTLTVQHKIVGPTIFDVEAGESYLVEAAVTSDLTMEMYFGLAVDKRQAGRPMPILISLSENVSIAGAIVLARITDPADGTHLMLLFDDGQHGDGAAADGFYGNTFYQTHLEGGYVVEATAGGSTPLAGSFVRRLRGSFNMEAGADTDGDNVPNWYEAEIGTDPNVSDTGSDVDFDGLDLPGEFENGSNPFDSDSDNGGGGDGSEVNEGTNPTNPSDDQIACPLDFQVVNGLHSRDEETPVSGVVLLFSVDATHDHFEVLRAENAGGPWSVIDAAVPPTGLYIDMTAMDGLTYYYMLQAVGSLGHKSCLLGPRTITSVHEETHPEGIVQINEGAAETDSFDVNLSFDATPDVTEMRIGNPDDFGTAVWESYHSSKSWHLEPEGATAVVFVQFRNAAGLESEVIADSILIGTCSKGAVNITASFVQENAGSFTNNAASCRVEVGVAVYEKVDEIIDNQIFFDGRTEFLDPGESTTIDVSMPRCASQIDLFHGELLASLNGQRYGNRLLRARHYPGDGLCVAQGIIEGVILLDDHPLEGVTVSLAHQISAGVVLSQTTTDELGAFRFDKLPARIYVLTLSGDSVVNTPFDGYTQQVSVNMDGVTAVELTELSEVPTAVRFLQQAAEAQINLAFLLTLVLELWLITLLLNRVAKSRVSGFKK